MLVLLIDFVDTSLVSGVTCTPNGDLYILSGGRGPGMLSEGVTFAYAVSDSTVCAHEQLEDTLRIYGCQKASSLLLTLLKHRSSQINSWRLWTSY